MIPQQYTKRYRKAQRPRANDACLVVILNAPQSLMCPLIYDGYELPIDPLEKCMATLWAAAAGGVKRGIRVSWDVLQSVLLITCRTWSRTVEEDITPLTRGRC